MKFTLLLLSLLAAVAPLQGQRRELMLRHWQFSRDNAHFSEVTVPHDWAISGPFDKQADMQTVAIVQNGETEKSEITGRTGALPWIGKGYYRCTLPLKALPQRALLCFDGAMSEPHVFVNGVEAGWWAYGYNAFRLDVTRLLQRGDNLIEVHLENRPESSRWYPGAGIYRPVTLLLTSATAIDDWKSFVRTESLQGGVATVDVLTKLTERPKEQLSLVSRVRDEEGKVVFTTRMDNVTSDSLSTQFRFTNPRLWSPETPYLYTLERQLLSSGRVVDTQVQRFGIRTVSVSRDKGFQLNGVSRKFKGVCLHHDLGPLGAALNKAALIRQIKLLKEMGCDAIRTSHNMPSTLQMDLCDSLGMMVMAESFDMWKYPKCRNGYAIYFDEWAERDLTNELLHHRNHPSIVMWSIGNEIPDQTSAWGAQQARRFVNLCHRLDPTRPVTQGVDMVDGAVKAGLVSELDVPGFNYRLHRYDAAYKALPQGFVLGSETASTFSSRGVYHFPPVPNDTMYCADGQCNSYDVDYGSWSNLPDDDFMMQDDRPWTIGQFVWTGFDYLGEPTPYDRYWPSRSSYFGIFDLAGLPKDRYWLYRSVWNTEEHTLHLLPHWTWPGREGKVTPVYCYTDYPSAELFVNGKSQGRIFKNHLSTVTLGKSKNLDRYRLRWNNVVYEPGELKVVAYDDNRNKAAEETVHTAGAPVKIKLEADRKMIHADGDDIAFVTVSLLDKDGNEIPTSTDELLFSVEGKGRFKAACNGDATSLEPFTEPRMKLFSGKLVVLVQSTTKKGTITLMVTDKSRDMEAKIKIKSC
ncbi:MAG: glycoside hydrolase family 2 TIM barrel-domain containing protein [Prevotella sp.]|nr:glycoside hydrolase family 2 TIM barrel-domain containing protein [Prevotella sp.]